MVGEAELKEIRKQAPWLKWVGGFCIAFGIFCLVLGAYFWSWYIVEESSVEPSVELELRFIEPPILGLVFLVIGMAFIAFGAETLYRGTKIGGAVEWLGVGAPSTKGIPRHGVEPTKMGRLPSKAEVLEFVKQRGEVNSQQLYNEGFGDVGRGPITVGMLRELVDEGCIRLVERNRQVIWRYERELKKEVAPKEKRPGVRFCSKCASELGADAFFCSKCGAKIE